MAKFLIVDDDLLLGDAIKHWLEQRNNEVDVVTNGDDGLYWLSYHPYTAAVLDWELPKLSGIEICRRYREQGGQIPILILTGRHASGDVITGLESGADDYLAKPFDLAVLHARLKALARRPSAVVDSAWVRHRDVELDVDAALVKKGTSTICLARKELLILELLMKQPGRIVNPETLINHIWPSDTDVSLETVRCHVTRLRSKLGKIGEGDLVKTVYWLGYKVE